MWGTRLEMLHTACQCKGETLSFPVCSCWYIYMQDFQYKLKVGQVGNMMFGFPGHCMVLLLFFNAIRGSKRHLRVVGKVGEGASWTKTVNESAQN